LDEDNETFTVDLSSPTNATIADGQGEGAINDDDDPPAISIDDVAVSEGDSGTTNATFTVSLSAESGKAISVDYTTADGTATTGDDYTAVSTTTLNFTAGITTRTVTIQVAGDELDEDNETFTVDLSSPTNATIADGQGEGAINDDDDPPTVDFDSGSYTVNEDVGVATITVTLSTLSGKTVTVDYATSNGTATADSDYTPASSTLIFTPGLTSQTFTVPIIDDTENEPSETITLTLSLASQATIGGNSPATLTVEDNDFTLTWNVAGSGSIGLNPDQSTYTYGEVVTLTATADAGWTFAGWSGDLSGSTTPITLTMIENKVVTATFTQDEYTLKTTAVGNGWVITNPAKSTYTYGEVVTLTAFALPGWTFSEWSGDLSGSTTPVTVTITGNKSVTATFTQDEYTLAVMTVGSGSVVSNPAKSTYTYGEVVTLTATADPGWTFMGWSGDLSGDDNPKAIVMTGNKAVTATFVEAYTLTVTTIGSGTVVTEPARSVYASGEVVTLTATANPGWTFTDWSGDLIGSTTPVTLTMNRDKAVTATFTQDPYTLTVTSPVDGQVLTASVISVIGQTNPGSMLTVTVNTGDSETGMADPTDGTFTIGNIDLLVGSNVLIVESGDAYGNLLSETLTVILTNDSTDLTNTLAITSPTNGQVLTTSVISVIGQTDPDSVLTVTVNTGDSETGTADLTDGFFTIGNVDLLDGVNTIIIESRDPYGNLISETLTVTFIDLSLDHDGDGILTGGEDVNGDGDPTNDDTDGDGIPNYLDPDDDGDGTSTANEDVNGDGDPTNDDLDRDGTPDYLDPDVDHDGDGVSTVDEDLDGDGDATNDDTDGDGIPNYLDLDDDGDGIPTADEDVNGDGDPTNDDTDGDGIPNYLDPDVVTLGFSKTAQDIDGAPLSVGDTIRYTVQVTNTGNYTAFNLIVTDTLPVSVTLIATSTSQGSTAGTEQIVWNVGNLSPGGGTATMVITVTLDADTQGQSIINSATVGGYNVGDQTDVVCPDGGEPNNGVCDSPPQKPLPPTQSGGVFLPIILRGG
jgi:uncharacterized repeat protein (TIGR01451 family)/uncharacterized repeat protein (TIGR02543 family)